MARTVEVANMPPSQFQRQQRKADYALQMKIEEQEKVRMAAMQGNVAAGVQPLRSSKAFERIDKAKLERQREKAIRKREQVLLSQFDRANAQNVAFVNKIEDFRQSRMTEAKESSKNMKQLSYLGKSSAISQPDENDFQIQLKASPRANSADSNELVMIQENSFEQNSISRERKSTTRPPQDYTDRLRVFSSELSMIEASRDRDTQVKSSAAERVYDSATMFSSQNGEANIGAGDINSMSNILSNENLLYRSTNYGKRHKSNSRAVHHAMKIGANRLALSSMGEKNSRQSGNKMISSHGMYSSGLGQYEVPSVPQTQLGRIFSPKDGNDTRFRNNVPQSRATADQLNLPEINNSRQNQREGAKSVRSKREIQSLLTNR